MRAIFRPLNKCKITIYKWKITFEKFIIPFA